MKNIKNIKSLLIIKGMVTVAVLTLILFSYACKSDTAPKVSSKTPVEYVNNMIGTYNTYQESFGNLYPAVAVPFGMNFYTLQTGKNGDGWGYQYQRDSLVGFKQTHQPSPWINDYAAFSIMPVEANSGVLEQERKTSYSHTNEISKPYFYSNVLEGISTKVSFSASERGAIFEIENLNKKEVVLVIDANKGGSSLTKESGKVVIGTAKNNSGGVPDNFANYFRMEFSQEIDKIEFFQDDKMAKAESVSINGDRCLAKIYFKATSVIVKSSSSFISSDQAKINLDQEIGKLSLEELKKVSMDKWNLLMGRIEVEDKNEVNKEIFYSSLYRSLLFPRAFFEINGKDTMYYSPYDGKIKKGVMFTDNGFWDTFRSVHPMFNLIYPEVSAMIVKSVVNSFNESGFLPQWMSPGHRDCMIGNNANSIIADAILKGVAPLDRAFLDNALEAMISDSKKNDPKKNSVGRLGWKEYWEQGYVPCDKYSEATARTLEYAYNDFCIAKVAEKMDKNEVKETYLKLSENYKNVFDKSVGFMRGKLANGQWKANFDPYEWGGPFTEGNSWHYTWSVFQNPRGLVELMGGDAAFEKKMDSIFSVPNSVNPGSYGGMIHEMTEMVNANMGQYAHGNQPIQHAIYLYNYIGKPEKTQYWINQVMTRLYKNNEKGYCGDEDNGQTSSWYVWSALGFYPVNPVSGKYIIGTPMFDKVTLNLANGNKFVVNATSSDSEKGIYIKKTSLDGKEYKRLYLEYLDIVKGGEITFEMSKEAVVKEFSKDELQF